MQNTKETIEVLNDLIQINNDRISGYEKAIKEQRLRREISQAKKSNAFYIKQSEKAKQIKVMEIKKEKKENSSALVGVNLHEMFLFF